MKFKYRDIVVYRNDGFFEQQKFQIKDYKTSSSGDTQYTIVSVYDKTLIKTALETELCYENEV